jgi:hypothetical protein
MADDRRSDQATDHDLLVERREQLQPEQEISGGGRKQQACARESHALFLLVSVIPLGLGLLVLIPVLVITSYTVYRDVFVESI